MSLYLQAGEYTTYGLAGSTTAAQVQTASGLIDTFLRRPEGLLWTADTAGNPCFMSGATPTSALTSTGSISPGLAVVVAVAGPVMMAQPGDTYILDRANTGATEAVTVIATGPSSVTLKQVAYAHSPGALLESDLVITEQRFLPDMRPITTLSRAPVVRITSGSGRYGYGRRGDSGGSSINDFNLLAALSHFGGPPVWEVFDPLNTDVDARTGQCWIPAGIMLAYYTEVKIRYVAGFKTAPEPVKQACATLVTAIASDPGVGPVKSYKAGDTAIQLWADTLISGDVRRALLPYQAKPFA